MVAQRSTGSRTEPSRSPSHLLYLLKGAVRNIRDIASQLETKTLTPGLHHRRHQIWQEAVDILFEPSEDGSAENNNLEPVQVQTKPGLVKRESPGKSPPMEASRQSAVVADIEALQKQMAALEAKLEHSLATHIKHEPSATAEGFVLNKINIPAGKMESEQRYQYATLFGKYAFGAESIYMQEPFLQLTHQVSNFQRFVECVFKGSEERLKNVTLHTRSMTPFLGDVCQQWKERGVNIDVKLDPSLHVREITFSNGIVITSDRGIDLYRAPIRKGQWRVTHRALVEIKKLEQDQPPAVMSPDLGRRRRHRSWTPELHVKKEPSSELLRGEAGEADLERERSCMMTEHAMSLARERYEYFHDGNGMTADEIRHASQEIAVWDLQSQHFFEDGARRVGEVYPDGTIHFDVAPYTVNDERIIRLPDPYVFRVSDTYHQLYIDYFYNSEYFYNNYVDTDSSVMRDGDDDTGSEDSDDMETD